MLYLPRLRSVVLPYHSEIFWSRKSYGTYSGSVANVLVLQLKDGSLIPCTRTLYHVLCSTGLPWRQGSLLRGKNEKDAI